MGFFEFLRPKKADRSASVTPSCEAGYQVRAELMDAVRTAITGILEMNFALMGTSIGNAPFGSGITAKRSRGYLLGLAKAILERFEALRPSDDEFIYTLATTYMLAHGQTDGMIGIETMQMHAMGDAPVMDGAALAFQDVQAVYCGKAWATPTGFWLIRQGDEAALQYNLDMLRADESAGG